MNPRTLVLSALLVCTPLLHAQSLFTSSFENEVGIADVTWSTDVNLIEGDDTYSLQNYDSASGTYEFDSAGLAMDGITLTTGELMIVDGVGMGRIVTVNDDGTTTTVTTSLATLDEAIESGQLTWDLDMSYENLAQSSVLFGKTTCSPSVTGLTATFACEFNGFTLSMSVTGGRTQSSIQFQVTRALSDENKVALTGTGTISPFNQQANIDYANNTLESANIDNRDLQFDITVDGIATASGNVDIKYDIPVPVFRIPFTIGPIPASVDIGARIRMEITVPEGTTAFASGKADFSYNGSTGLTFNGSSTDFNATTDVFNPSNGSVDSVGPLGTNFRAAFGIAFPRITLSILNQEVAYILVGPIIDSLYYTSPICKEARAIVLVQGGYGLEILGNSLFSEDIEIQRDQLVVPQGGCRPAAKSTADLILPWPEG